MKRIITTIAVASALVAGAASPALAHQKGITGVNGKFAKAAILHKARADLGFAIANDPDTQVSILGCARRSRSTMDCSVHAFCPDMGTKWLAIYRADIAENSVRYLSWFTQVNF